MSDNIERLLDNMEETIVHLQDEGDDWLANIVQQAFDFIEEKLQEVRPLAVGQGRVRSFRCRRGTPGAATGVQALVATVTRPPVLGLELPRSVYLRSISALGVEVLPADSASVEVGAFDEPTASSPANRPGAAAGTPHRA